MRERFNRIFRSWPLFLFALPVFFFLHGLSYNYAPDLDSTALQLTVLFMAIGTALSLLFFPFFRNYKKAALSAFLLLLYFFFFGNLLNTAKDLLGEASLLTRYLFILPFSLVAGIFLLVWIRNSKKELKQVFVFLNTLLIILVGYEVVTYLSVKSRLDFYGPADLTKQLVRCDTCKKPDIYIIIADEYAGRQQLKEIFEFDNAGFENDLRKRGFHIIEDPRSNYNHTVFTVASLLSMDYVRLTHPEKMHPRDLQISRSSIAGNTTGAFLTGSGYTLYNFSAFNVQGQERAIYHYFFPPKKELLTFQTFLSRFSRDAGHQFPALFRKIPETKLEYFNNNNKILDSLVISTFAPGKPGPKWVYTHFNMPHFPYFYDSAGNPNKNAALAHADFSLTKKEYTGYLQYTNKKLLALTDHILANSAEPPVILLLSDHGFRNSEYNFPNKYVFMNMCAVYLPGGDYTHFYRNISTVNIFRALFNAEFGQRLPLLKDSTIYVPD